MWLLCLPLCSSERFKALLSCLWASRSSECWQRSRPFARGPDPCLACSDVHNTSHVCMTRSLIVSWLSNVAPDRVATPCAVEAPLKRCMHVNECALRSRNTRHESSLPSRVSVCRCADAISNAGVQIADTESRRTAFVRFRENVCKQLIHLDRTLRTVCGSCRFHTHVSEATRFVAVCSCCSTRPCKASVTRRS